MSSLLQVWNLQLNLGISRILKLRAVLTKL
jgi:hypothetical protein